MSLQILKPLKQQIQQVSYSELTVNSIVVISYNQTQYLSLNFILELGRQRESRGAGEQEFSYAVKPMILKNVVLSVTVLF